MPIERKLAAIMFTDIAGYTALSAKDSTKTSELLNTQRDILKPIVEKHGGLWIKEIGDALLLLFDSATSAVECSIAIQEAIIDIEDLNLRIGIHEGEVIKQDGDVIGDDVNIASRIEPYSAVGGVAISDKIYRTISSNKEFETKYIGKPKLKGVSQEVKVYCITSHGLPHTDLSKISVKLEKKSNLTKYALSGGVCVLVGFLFFLFSHVKVHKDYNVYIIKASEWEKEQHFRESKYDKTFAQISDNEYKMFQVEFLRQLNKRMQHEEYNFIFANNAMHQALINQIDEQILLPNKDIEEAQKKIIKSLSEQLNKNHIVILLTKSTPKTSEPRYEGRIFEVVGKSTNSLPMNNYTYEYMISGNQAKSRNINTLSENVAESISISKDNFLSEYRMGVGKVISNSSQNVYIANSYIDRIFSNVHDVSINEIIEIHPEFHYKTNKDSVISINSIISFIKALSNLDSNAVIGVNKNKNRFQLEILNQYLQMGLGNTSDEIKFKKEGGIYHMNFKLRCKVTEIEINHIICELIDTLDVPMNNWVALTPYSNVYETINKD